MRWPRPIPIVGDATSAAERRADPSAWRFDDAEREALYTIIAARRDVRRFRPDPLDPTVVRRLLAAAHAAPSVGHSQPWRFVLVGQATTRERAAVIAERERLRQASLLAEDASRRMLDLQLDGIREAPLGIVVCCDRRAEAPGVLGRATFPDSDLWSCTLAIENLWLAARRGARAWVGDAVPTGRTRRAGELASRRRDPRMALSRLARRAPSDPWPRTPVGHGDSRSIR